MVQTHVIKTQASVTNSLQVLNIDALEAMFTKMEEYIYEIRTQSISETEDQWRRGNDVTVAMRHWAPFTRTFIHAGLTIYHSGLTRTTLFCSRRRKLPVMIWTDKRCCRGKLIHGIISLIYHDMYCRL